MTRKTRLSTLVCVCCAVASAAWAQPDIRANEWTRGTTLIGSAGVGGDSWRTDAAFGGAVGWELTRTFAIEGSGVWMEQGTGVNGFGGALTLRARLFGGERAAPFVRGGIGLRRMTFKSADDDVPSFYRSRLLTSAAGVRTGTFTDPTIVGAGGMTIALNRSLAIRPDVEAAVALNGGRTHVFTTVTMQLVYHFEHHPVTPGRRP
jgi:hypothetical protein